MIINLIFALLSLFFIPFFMGITVLSFFKTDSFSLSIIEIPGVAFCLGLAAFVFPCAIGYLLKFPLQWFFFVLMSAVLLVNIIKYKKIKALVAQSMTLSKNGVLWIVFLVFSVAVGFIGNFMNITSDSTHHLTYITKFIGSGTLNSENFYLFTTTPIDELTTTYVYNIIFPLFAFVAKLTSVDSVLLWKYSLGVLTFIALSSVYSTSKRFFHSHYIALVSLILLSIYFGTILVDTSGYSMFALRCLSYPNHIAGIITVVLIGILYEEVRKLKEKIGNSNNLIVLFFIAGGLPLIHLQWWAYFIFVIFTMFAILLWKKEFKLLYKIIVPSFLYFGISSALFLLKLPYYNKSSDDLLNRFTNPHLKYEIFGLDFFNPIVLFRMPTLIFISIMLVYLFFFIKDHKTKTKNESIIENPTLFLSCLSIAIITFLLSPLSINVCARLTSVCIIGRMNWALDMFLILLCGAIIYEFLQKTFKAERVNKYIIFVTITSMFFCFAKNFRAYYSSIKYKQLSLSSLALNKDFKKLMLLIEPRSIVASPTLEKNIIQVFADVQAGVRTHAKDKKDEDQIQNIIKVFSGKLDYAQIVNILSKQSASYIFLMLTQKEKDQTFFLEDVSPILIKVFDQQITPNERFILYKINHET